MASFKHCSGLRIDVLSSLGFSEGCRCACFLLFISIDSHVLWLLIGAVFVVSGYVEDVFLGSLNSLPWEGVQCVANPYA